MNTLTMRVCIIVTVNQKNKSFIIFIGSDISFRYENNDLKFGKITSIIPGGFYLNNDNTFFNWDKVIDIESVNTGNVLDFLK